MEWIDDLLWKFGLVRRSSNMRLVSRVVDVQEKNAELLQSLETTVAMYTQARLERRTSPCAQCDREYQRRSAASRKGWETKKARKES